MGTFNWNWEVGPPADAYSRVSRDLAVVSASFGVWLDELPDRLCSEYDCGRRPAEESDLDRFDRRTWRAPIDEAWVVEPVDGRSASLVVVRHLFDGGFGARFGIGRAIEELVPDCFCDSCDQDGDDLVEQAAELVAVVTDGFREFRRPHRPRRFEMLHNGPWLELGYESGDRRSVGASADIVGDMFDIRWTPWARR